MAIRRRKAENARTDHEPRITAAFNDGIMPHMRASSSLLRVRGTPTGDVDEGFVDVELIEALRTTDRDDEKDAFLRPDDMLRKMLDGIKSPMHLDLILYWFGLNGYPRLSADQITKKMGFRTRTAVFHAYSEAVDELQRVSYGLRTMAVTDGHSRRVHD